MNDIKHAVEEAKKTHGIGSEEGAIGYILAWFLGIPASVLFLIFLLRGCN